MVDSVVEKSAPTEPRRSFLATLSGLAMAVGLVAAYGMFGRMLAQFVYPTRRDDRSWLFVCTVDGLAPGESLDFETPSGAKIVVARLGDGAGSESFLALSSICPHLGCRVHWEGAQNRFFCPCHNGAFDRQGNPISGPPQAANQRLSQFPLKIERGLVFLQAPTAALVGRTATDSSSCRERLA